MPGLLIVLAHCATFDRPPSPSVSVTGPSREWNPVRSEVQGERELLPSQHRETTLSGLDMHTIMQLCYMKSEGVVQTVLAGHTESKPWGGNA
jgi:hypothetical protein